MSTRHLQGISEKIRIDVATLVNFLVSTSQNNSSVLKGSLVSRLRNVQSTTEEENLSENYTLLFARVFQ